MPKFVTLYDCLMGVRELGIIISWKLILLFVRAAIIRLMGRPSLTLALLERAVGPSVANVRIKT